MESWSVRGRLYLTHCVVKKEGILDWPKISQDIVGVIKPTEWPPNFFNEANCKKQYHSLVQEHLKKTQDPFPLDAAAMFSVAKTLAENSRQERMVQLKSEMEFIQSQIQVELDASASEEADVELDEIESIIVDEDPVSQEEEEKEAIPGSPDLIIDLSDIPVATEVELVSEQGTESGNDELPDLLANCMHKEPLTIPANFLKEKEGTTMERGNRTFSLFLTPLNKPFVLIREKPAVPAAPEPEKEKPVHEEPPIFQEPSPQESSTVQDSPPGDKLHKRKSPMPNILKKTPRLVEPVAATPDGEKEVIVEKPPTSRAFLDMSLKPKSPEEPCNQAAVEEVPANILEAEAENLAGLSQATTIAKSPSSSFNLSTSFCRVSVADFDEPEETPEHISKLNPEVESVDVSDSTEQPQEVSLSLDAFMGNSTEKLSSFFKMMGKTKGDSLSAESLPAVSCDISTPTRSSDKLIAEAMVLMSDVLEQELSAEGQNAYKIEITEEEVCVEDEEPAELSKTQKKLLLNLIKQLQQMSHMSQFWKLPNPATNQSFYSIIKRPIDLYTIKKGIETGGINSIMELQRDLRLMFLNAFMYQSKRGPDPATVMRVQEECMKLLEENLAAHWNSQTMMLVQNGDEKILKMYDSFEDLRDSLAPSAGTRNRTSAENSPCKQPCFNI